MGKSKSGFLIQDHSDHGASKEPMNLYSERICRVLWYIIPVILNQKSGFGFPKETHPKLQCDYCNQGHPGKFFTNWPIAFKGWNNPFYDMKGRNVVVLNFLVLLTRTLWEIYCFIPWMLLVNLRKIFWGGLGWSSRTVISYCLHSTIKSTGKLTGTLAVFLRWFSFYFVCRFTFITNLIVCSWGMTKEEDHDGK